MNAPIADSARQRAWANLAAALREGRVKLGVNMAVANRPRSPVFDRSEQAVPLFLSFFIVIGAILLGGPLPGLLALGAAGALFLGVIQPRLRDRVYDRALALALRGEKEFQMLWSAGAISLQHASGTGEVRGPEGDWIGFGQALESG